MNEPTISFRVPRPEIDTFRQLAATKGFPLFGDSGIVNFRGIIFRFQYDEPILTINIEGKPRFMSLDFIRRKVSETLGVKPIDV